MARYMSSIRGLGKDQRESAHDPFAAAPGFPGRSRTRRVRRGGAGEREVQGEQGLPGPGWSGDKGRGALPEPVGEHVIEE